MNGFVLCLDGSLVESSEKLLDADKGLEFFHGTQHLLEFLVLGDCLYFESFFHVMIILVELVICMLGFLPVRRFVF